MKVFKCDRCGEIYEWYRYVHSNDGKDGNGIARIVMGKDKTSCVDYIDLCPSCMKEFYHWMNREGKYAD